VNLNAFLGWYNLFFYEPYFFLFFLAGAFFAFAAAALPASVYAYFLPFTFGMFIP